MAEWLTLSQALEREPALSNHILGAMYFPEEGQVLAPELSTAYIKAAAVLGAEIREYAEVKSLLIMSGKVLQTKKPYNVIRSLWQREYGGISF